MTTDLSQTLEQLGGKALDRKIQCFDQAGGCISALYNTQIIQSTGFLYDCYLFVHPADQGAAAEQDNYRQAFFRDLSKRKPEYLVVSSDECGLQNRNFDYAKLKEWPLLANYLNTQYQIKEQHNPSGPIVFSATATLPYGFRIYARRPGGAQ